MTFHTIVRIKNSRSCQFDNNELELIAFHFAKDFLGKLANTPQDTAGDLNLAKLQTFNKDENVSVFPSYLDYHCAYQSQN